MLTDPGHIAAAVAATSAKPVYKIEICWDGVNWTDETGNTVLGFTVRDGIIDPFQGLASMGDAPVGKADITVDNYNGRFSQDHSGSQAAVYGIYGLGIRLSAGYYYGATPEYVRVFTGRIMDVTESERGATATLTCHDLGSIPMQQKYSTMIYEGTQINSWISTLATLASVGSTDLEQALTVIPYAYLDDDYALDEVKRAAQSEGGVAFFDVNGTLTFWNAAHWANASSVATMTATGYGELEPRRAYSDIYNVIAVEYQPRQAGQVDKVYSLDRAVMVPPAGSKELKLKLRTPLASFAEYDLSACSSGGADMVANVTVVPTSPDAAASWTATFSNSDTRQAAYITRFDVYGEPVVGRPAETYELNQSGTATPRRKDIRGNWYIQTETQAKLIASVLGQRFKTLRVSLALSGMPANPLLEVGDVVTVTGTRTGINQTAIITSRELRGGKSFKMSLELSDFTSFYPYTGYLVVGTSAIGASGGRLFA